MPRVSRKVIKKEMLQELDDYFVSLISGLVNPNQIRYFLNDFLTLEEKVMLAKRLMVHLMLENGYGSSQIENVVGVSRETIRIHRSIWSRGGQAYKRIIGRISKKEKSKRFWQKVEKILTPLDLALRSGTDMRARAKIYSGNWFDEN